MAVPTFEDFLYPFLLQLKGKNMTHQEMREFMVKHWRLTEEDCTIRTQGGSTTQFDGRLGWTRQYLRRAELIESPQRGIYQITQRGREYLTGHTSLKISDLLQYPEFANFQNRKKSKEEVAPADTVIEKDEKLTPTEQLEGAYQQISDDLAEDILKKVSEMTPSFFEHLVLDLLLKMGYGDSRDGDSAIVTPYTGDDGVDGIISQDKLGLDKIYFQAKKYSKGNIVDKPQIQEFSGALDEQKANKGVFITTSSYTKGARSFIEKTSKKIVLIDGEKLAHYMIEYNIGVSTYKIYEVKRMDSDYFEE